MSFLVGQHLSWAITATAGSGFLLFGYDQGVMAGLLTGDAFVRTFPEIDTTPTGHGSSSLQGTVVAIYEIGCFLGALLALFFGERLGRRYCIMIGCVILTVGAALQCSAFSIPHMIVGRIVAGVGNGMNTSTIPVWHSELSKAASRGKAIAIELCINIFGVMMAYWVDYGMSYVVNDAQFRFPIALQIIFAITTFLGTLFLPESPRWLIAHGKPDEGRHIIWALQPNARSIAHDDQVINIEIDEITQAIIKEQQATLESSFKMVFTNGPQRFLHRTLLGMGGQMMQQLSGVNLITYYNTVIFENSVGMDHNTALLVAGFNGVAYFISTLIPIWTIDRVGRRKLMLFAAAGQCTCMAILAGTVYDGGHGAGIVATVMLFLFNFFFGIGLLGVAWLLPAEYAPLAVRTRSAALATATNWIFTFLVVEITPVSIAGVGYRTYIYFASDETKPMCVGCKRRGEKCQWRMLGSFREANLKVLEPEHPSMKQSASRKQNNKFKILNVQPRKSQDQESPRASPKPVDDINLPDANNDIDDLNDNNDNNDQQPEHDFAHNSPVNGNDALPAPTPAPPTATATATATTTAPAPTPPLDHSPSHHLDFTNHSPSSSHDSHVSYLSSPDFMGLISHSSFSEGYPAAMASPLFDHGVFSDPANVANIDVFVPGSAYEALHTALRNRQLWTARPDIPSRGSTPDIVPGVAPNDTRARPGRGFTLSLEREIILWQNYLNEICTWLDMFDNHRHFASTFPQMAKSSLHLRYSILALSARQMERKQNEKSQSESLSLYQEAIHLLLPELESKTTPVIASCVILCVLEMLSCNPKEWRRHLDGCAFLIQAAEINGFSGKEEQALFWCFARMDVCGGLISEEETIIPIHNWTPRTMNPHQASQLFLASKANFDTYANYTVYLCAQTLGVLCGASKHHHSSCFPCHYLDRDMYVDRWKGLLDRAEQCFWEPIISCLCIIITTAETEDSFVITEAKIRFMACPANLRHFSFKHTSVCTISLIYGCWTNALQPLWLAGKAMSHCSEHEAIVNTLTRIERETGWATAWRVEDLKEFWGDDD
ncbi:uncharacterized protein EURHEDRAFT_517850 [Aspergillus ruber CBS 135680]|uniref:Major facilitator superfamily (MFS) profile domain-containing protein n=1 Tax=Aspergillus ruber (strain CBS 135680) TaxID=1388766 RepID=A0A017S5R7_ASPRC|nr:uncharacterized protein EURHEDRAFT_517850 [Aspergillus ruber CBS 135680]EYE92302.1 hypothetical protein EURHEDRAFT_517850 [Aspergillus ruber CBS 135680]